MQSLIISAVIGALFGALQYYGGVVRFYGRFYSTPEALMGLAVKAMQWAVFCGLVALIGHVIADSRLFHLAF